jgi:hypothetical protein
LLAAVTGKVAQIVATVMKKVVLARDSFSVMPLSRHTGAEIGSVDVSGPVGKANRQIAHRSHERAYRWPAEQHV